MTGETFPYEIIEEYVRGGCSVIYKIKPRVDGLGDVEEDQTQYVLKTMSVNDNDPQSYQRFYMEWEFLRAYPHPNLVKVKEYFKDWHGRPAYVMEWVRGETWQSYWKDKNPREDLQNFLYVCKQLCDALDYIHKHQIVHRDLKPQNILVSQDDIVKLIDFGIMKVADLTLFTHRNTFMGSAYYVAPEGISGEQVNHTADIFALGVMLYDLFTGVKPFQGHTLGETIYQRLAKKPQPPSQLAELPIELDAVILKMMEREPRNRQQSCSEVFAQLEKVFGKFVPETTVDDLPDIDVLTKGPFFHSNLLRECRIHLQKHHLLFLKGDEGSGKTTLIENICSREFEDVLRLDCTPGANELGFMEAVLKNIHIPNTSHRELQQWREILGSVMPGLRWPTPPGNQVISPGTVLTAFKRLLLAASTPTVLVIEDLHHSSSSLLRLVQQIAALVASKENERLYLLLSSRETTSEISDLGKPFEMTFPDVINLTDYLTAEFGGCQIPMELTQSLATMSENNLTNFIRLVQRSKARDNLSINDGVLAFDSSGDLLGLEEDEDIPFEIQKFTSRQVKCLEWVALCPEVDVNTLRKVAGFSLDELGATVDRAANLDLFEFQSSGGDGFHWRNETVRHYLLSSLSDAEKTRRYLALAKTVESESKRFLSYSPPLWLVLCRLYQQAGEDERAAHYALDYARYCSQTANYKPVREILNPFISLPIFQDNQVFWSMLAMANRDGDIKGALYFAQKALKIKENAETLALSTILEFQAGNFKSARVHLKKLLGRKDIADLDAQYTSQLMPILMSLDQLDQARMLFSQLHRRLKGRNDLYATNTLLVARLRLLIPWPDKILFETANLSQELLPRTQRILQVWVLRALQDKFEFNKALGYLQKLEGETHRGSAYYHEALLLFLNFERSVHLKNLISLYRESMKDQPEIAHLSPLFQLASEILLQDPKIYEFDRVLELLEQARVEKSVWLVVIATRLGFANLSEEFLAGVLDMLNASADPFARHRMGRLQAWLELKRGERLKPKLLLQQAATRATEYDLSMEQLRLYSLHQFLSEVLGPMDSISLPQAQALLSRPNALQFVKAQYPRG